MKKVAEEKVRTVKDLLEKYERIKNSPIVENITLTPEALFYMFMAYFQKLQNEIPCKIEKIDENNKQILEMLK